MEACREQGVHESHTVETILTIACLDNVYVGFTNIVDGFHALLRFIRQVKSLNQVLVHLSDYWVFLSKVGGHGILCFPELSKAAGCVLICK